MCVGLLIISFIIHLMKWIFKFFKMCEEKNRKRKEKEETKHGNVFQVFRNFLEEKDLKCNKFQGGIDTCHVQ